MTQSSHPAEPLRRAMALPGASVGRFSILADFYREEFLKHQQCLEQQREYYSDSAFTSVEAALTRVLSQLERLSAKEDSDKVISRLLKKFNDVTGLSGWTDPKHLH